MAVGVPAEPRVRGPAGAAAARTGFTAATRVSWAPSPTVGGERLRGLGHVLRSVQRLSA